MVNFDASDLVLVLFLAPAFVYVCAKAVAIAWFGSKEHYMNRLMQRGGRNGKVEF